MVWENPVTTWGQAGKTVPIADDFNRIEENIRILGEYNRAPGYGTATGTNAKTITLEPAPTSYYDGLCFAFKNATQNTGAVTINVNGLGAMPIKKPNGNDIAAGNLKANSVYTVRYNGTNFILQGEGGEYGTATASDVLQGKTIGTEDGLVDGTMPNRGTVTNTITTQGGEYTIPSGYHNGSGKVTASFANLTAGNIKSGVNIGGIVGTYLGKRFVTGSNNSSNSKLTVSQSFGFVPSIIIAKNKSVNSTSVYCSSGLSKDYKFVYVNGSIANFAADITSVSSSGFTMTATYNDSYDWIAIE